jgi:hypothetical protein
MWQQYILAADQILALAIAASERAREGGEDRLRGRLSLSTSSKKGVSWLSS